MKLGMPTLVEYEAVENHIALCKELGLDFIELNMNLPFCTPEVWNGRDLARLKERHGIDFTVHLPEELDLSSFHPSIRRGHLERCKETMEWAKEAGIATINMHLNNGIYFTLPDAKVWINEAYKERFTELLLDSYEELYRLASAYRIELCIENTCNFHLPFVQEALAKLDSRFRQFYLTWDAGHDAKAGFREEPVLMRYAERIKPMHVHDYNGKSDHQPPGSGLVPIRERLRFARERRLSVVIEVKTSESLRHSLRSLRTFL
ncbi:sugar phosphate isomerase/epimerase family protein [Paenibacillus sp. GYB003]|uniref:sugar phosphate isomerase/epimerase family protein n=1 Tax=Paenibacillus sp. GYB003 TaxID=2994392 RepID=UPI002F969EBC